MSELKINKIWMGGNVQRCTNNLKLGAILIQALQPIQYFGATWFHTNVKNSGNFQMVGCYGEFSL